MNLSAENPAFEAVRLDVSRPAEAIKTVRHLRRLAVAELKGSGIAFVGGSQGRPLNEIGGGPHCVAESHRTVKRELLAVVGKGFQSFDPQCGNAAQRGVVMVNLQHWTAVGVEST